MRVFFASNIPFLKGGGFMSSPFVFLSMNPTPRFPNIDALRSMNGKEMMLPSLGPNNELPAAASLFLPLASGPIRQRPLGQPRSPIGTLAQPYVVSIKLVSVHVI